MIFGLKLEVTSGIFTFLSPIIDETASKTTFGFFLQDH